LETVFCFKPRPFEKGRQPVAFLGRPRGPVLSVDPPTRVRNAARGGSVGPPRSSDMDPRRGIRGPRRTRSTRRQRPDSPYIPGPWDGREPDAVRPLALRACTSLSGLPLKRYPRVVPSTPSSFHLTVLSPGPPVLLASPKSEPRTKGQEQRARGQFALASLSSPSPPRARDLPRSTTVSGQGAFPHPPSPVSASFRSDRLAVVASCA
jgi:hypothetical protein